MLEPVEEALLEKAGNEEFGVFVTSTQPASEATRAQEHSSQAILGENSAAPGDACEEVEEQKVLKEE